MKGNIVRLTYSRKTGELLSEKVIAPAEMSSETLFRGFANACGMTPEKMIDEMHKFIIAETAKGGCS